MEKVAALTQRTVPGASAVSVTLVERGRPSTIASTGEVAVQMDERQYDRGYGPCLACIEGGELVLVQDMAAESRWPDCAADAQRHGVGSSLSSTVPLQRGRARMQNRTVIEQVKGIHMAARRCTADEAFDLLVQLSQDSNRKLRDVARAVVDVRASNA